MYAKKTSASAKNKRIGGPPAKLSQHFESPATETRLILLRVLDEAMARTSDQIHARTEELAEIPLLFGRSSGFEKRMADVQAGKKETVNLPSQLKRFMKQQFPEYRFDLAV